MASEQGSILVIAALGMVVILGFAGLAIDMGICRSARRQLQAAVDAAALAGALELSACQGANNCPAVQAAAQTSFNENGLTGSILQTNCNVTASTGLRILVNNPPCYQSSDPNSGKSVYVEVVALQSQPAIFTSMLGFHSFALAVRAEAARTPNPNCIYSLDASGGNAITVDLLSSVTSTCGVVDESSAWNAFSCNVIAQMSAPSIEVSGGVQGVLCLNGTTPRTGIPIPNQADPFSSLAKPTKLPCGASLSSPYHGSPHQLVITIGSATLYPDASYCGGIVVGPLANVTFTPGTYILQSDPILTTLGGMTVSPLSTVTSTAATFYNYGPNGGITFLAPSLVGHVSMIAPTTGTYACMLFMQDAADTAAATILGSSSANTLLQGSFYFPNASVLYAASMATSYNTLIAKDVEFVATGGLQTTMNNNYTSIPGGCPMAGGGAVLVQ